MKKIFLVLIILQIYVEGSAQTINFYFAAPTASLNTAFGAGNTFGFARMNASNVMVPIMNGYRYIRVTPGNVAIFRATAPTGVKKTYDSLTTATSIVRRKLNRVIGLAPTNKISIISVFMFDDATGLSSDSEWLFCPSPNSGNLIAWPCATNWFSATNNTYYGKVSFGETAIAAKGDFQNWEATLLHEFSHTQMLSNSDTAVANCGWGNRCVSIAYGGDSGHWGEELQGDKQSPLDEGLATFWGLEHSPSSATRLTNFLNDNSSRFLLGSHSVLTGTPSIWNAPHVERFTTTIPERNADGNRIVTPPGYNPINLVSEHIHTGAGYQLRSYKWLDVPGQFVFNNEMMVQGFLNLYHRHAFAKPDSAFNKIYNVSKILAFPSDHQRHRYPVKVANGLAKQMELYANTAAGQQEAAARTLVSSIFPLALYDLLSHFGMSDADLRRDLVVSNYSVAGVPTLSQPLAFEAYMTQRADVKRLACPFLSDNVDCRQADAPIKLNDAISALLTYCKDPSRILK